MTRTEFLEARRAGIGSSDAAKILGLSRWGTALDVYLDKTLPPQPGPMATPLEWGQRLEPAIAAAAMDHFGWKLEKPAAAERHAEHPFLLSNPDRVNQDAEICEMKSAERADGWGPADTDEIPEHYWVQVQHQLAVRASLAPVRRGWMFVLIGQCDFRRYEVPYDPEYLATVLDPLAEFWRLVEARTPPEPDWAHPRVLDAVDRLYRPAAGTAVDLGADAAALADEYERLGRAAGEAKDARDAVKARLIAALGTAAEGRLPDGRCLTRKEITRAGYTVQPATYCDFRIKKARGK